MMREPLKRSLHLASYFIICLSGPVAADVLPRNLANRIRDVMSLSEQAMLRYVPDQCPEVAVASPAVGAHMREIRSSWKWDWRKQGRGDHTFSGLLQAPRDGVYHLHVRSAFNCLIEVGSHRIVDTTGLGPYLFWTGRVPLKAGAHPIKIQLTGRSSDVGLEVTGPGVKRRPLPREWLRSVQNTTWSRESK
jgi:hypothetical protein